MTEELIVSIAHDHAAGSLWRIRNTQKLFAWREFQGAPALEGSQPTFLVLDGQQRVTGLSDATPMTEEITPVSIRKRDRPRAELPRART